MNIPFQVKVPVDLAVELRDRLKGVEALHQRDLDRFGKRVRAGGDTDKILAEQRALGERARRVTIQHLIRVYISRGMAELASASPADLLALMVEDSIVGGRPGLEAKRGPRNAA